ALPPPGTDASRRLARPVRAEKNLGPPSVRPGTRCRGSTFSGVRPRNSRAAGELGLDGDGQIGLVEPAAGVGGAVPALQGDGAHVVAFFLVEDLEERLAEVGPDLRRGAAEVEQAVGAVVKDGHGAPALRFRFRLVEHRFDPPWSGRVPRSG